MIKGNIELVSFNDELHKYFYEGKELKGITTTISKVCGKSFPKTPQKELACSYGSQIHKECERWIKEGVEPCMSDSIWVKNKLIELMNKYPIGTTVYSSELRVSDFDGTASNVDIVLHTTEGVILMDIKTGKFDRNYCTWQLNAYRLMYENCYPEKVIGMRILNTKSKCVFPIGTRDNDSILWLLEKNKNGKVEE